MTVTQVYEILHKLPAPLGLPPNSSHLDAHIRVVDMDLSPLSSFHDVLLGIHHYIFEQHHNLKVRGRGQRLS